ncbi:MAG: hypothetical protein NC548_06015 [Lachnospiraceae bacterium]|nr:hypothetical protein [Lachnospiraceae bacterium]
MRVTNEMYPRGSVIIPFFDKTDSLSYLNGRPMIVMSVLDPFNSVSAICCTTRDRPGIEVSIYNHFDGKFQSENEYSIACPYRVHEVPIRNIIDWLGVINPITMQAITDAFAWHFGISQTPPPYMAQLLADEYAPKYNIANATNTPMTIAHGVCSLKERHRSFSAVDDTIIKAPGPATTYTGTSTHCDEVIVNTTPSKDEIHAALTNFINECLVPNQESEISVTELQQKFTEFSNISIHVNGFSRKFNLLIQTIFPAVKRGFISVNGMKKTGYIGVAFASSQNPSNVRELSDTERRAKIFTGLTAADRTDILLHRLRPGSTINNYALSTEDIGWLSKRIVDSFGFFRETFTEDIVKQIEQQGFHWQFIDTDKVAMVMLYGNWDRIKPSSFVKLKARFEYLVNTEHLDFSDLRKWPSIVNGHELKEMMSSYGGGANSSIALGMYSQLSRI